MAVKSGGGLNHRMGLFDMAMLKDNHLTNESDPRSLQQKINAFKKQYPEIRLELEADTLEQVNEFIKMGVIQSIPMAAALGVQFVPERRSVLESIAKGEDVPSEIEALWKQ